ncbi:MAG: tRNA (adenosine(37)-N6)-threonylcarbamoyltransferase complex transferase subunit TsaD [Thermodesulfobacteriota bacterium]|nr:tRNA (adenosine(37)-N6)-threonylcarbamoyltransferase complex transferase subunit TsaD [Thermodesulfobacteriota bacterium]
MIILAIESSCDETAAAVLEDDKKLLSNVINSQIDIHGKYGGVVPELASRKHLEDIYPVVREALNQADVSLNQVDGLAVTQGPGLIGCLLVGLSFTKALSLVKKIPYVGVDHMAGHLLSVFLADTKPNFPFVALIASGGHSSIFLASGPASFQLMGRTRDDAAGEAFDKVGKLLGLTYPGGPVISKLAATGNSSAIAFPRAWLNPDSLDFSFSGLKTSVANYVNQQRQRSKDLQVEDICASFQEAVVDVLVEKTITAARRAGVNNVVLGGGVAANPRLRELMSKRTAEENLQIFMPPSRFCTDNAAMIGLAGYHLFQAGLDTLATDMDAYSRSLFF